MHSNYSSIIHQQDPVVSDYVECHEPNSSDDNVCEGEQTFVSNFVKFCLQLRERYILPQRAYETIINDMTALFSHFHQNLIKHFKSEVGFNEHLENPNFLPDLWKKLQNKSMFEQSCQSLGLVQPETVKSDNNITFQYVPIVKSLSNYLNQQDVLQAVLLNNRSCASKTNVLCDFTDGEYFRTKSYFRGNQDLLRFHFYCDELEVCNPLGSSKTKHKLTVFYYYVGNIGVKHSASLKNILLALLIESKKLKTIGYHTALKPLIKDLQFLQEKGIITCDGAHTLYGTIATLSADNLGAHELGGFRKCFSSGRICRFCMCLHSELKQKTCEEDFVLRNPTTHAQHVSGVEMDSTLSCAYGVLESCAFSSVIGFSPVTSLPPDIMHDCMEGVQQYFLQYLFRHLSSEKICSISELNEKLSCFPYGPTDYKNKPRSLPGQVVRVNGKFSMCASETWCLFRLIPLVVGHLVPEGDKAWK
ncbi:uncharacterized protein LOC144742535 [Ciona intestinalis]